jgi:HopJ type III effector protein
MLPLPDFLHRLHQSPDTLQFSDTLALIEAHYDFTPVAFQNGALHNAAGQNSGSCKLLSFAQLHGLTAQETLHCFGAYYRDDVLPHPTGIDHQNIRNFMQHGWAGVVFEGVALQAK